MSAALAYRPVHGGYPDVAPHPLWGWPEQLLVPIRWLSAAEVEDKLRAYSGARGWTPENGDEG